MPVCQDGIRYVFVLFFQNLESITGDFLSFLFTSNSKLIFCHDGIQNTVLRTEMEDLTHNKKKKCLLLSPVSQNEYMS